jgi:hypothetical protein
MKSNRWVSRAAGAGALTLILAMPAVAQTRGDWQRNDNNGRDGAQTTSRTDVRNTTRNASRNTSNTTRNNNNRDANTTRNADATRNVETTRNINTTRNVNTSRNDNRATGTANRSYRENDHVALSGRISSFSHESNGYRVRLDRGQSFFVPESYYRSHTRNFGIGVSINLGGIFRGGDIYVDAGNYPVYGAYDNGYVRGVIDRVDYRTGIAWLRDDASGRLIEADLRDAGRYSRIDGRDLRRGDYVELTGQWLRGNIFAVQQIDGVQTGRY